jgi:aspartyl-tRNA(Asn)/glutamyl-tRNA(Gln) amidotransferase subunit C
MWFNPPIVSDKELTLADVQNVAHLARLALDDAALRRLTPQLSSILHYVEKLGEVDMAGVEPMAHALPVSNVLGSDIAEPGLSLEQVLQNAPETDGPFFKVPKVLGGEDSAG